jgi:hypothetical protein
VGYIIAGIRELQAAKVGDTVTLIRPGTGGAAATATEADDRDSLAGLAEQTSGHGRGCAQSCCG